MKLCIILVGIAVALVLQEMPAPAQQAQQDGRKESSGVREVDAQDVIFYGPNHPVFVRVHLQLDGKALRAGSTFEISAVPQRPAQSVDLFSMFDLNHDGQLTPAEFEAAGQTLRKLDLDDDETFSLAELSPYQDQFVQQQASQMPAANVDLPFAVLASGESYAAVAGELLKRYDDPQRASDKGRLTAEELGTEPRLLAPFDTDGDGGLNAAELAQFLHNPPIHVELIVQFYMEKPLRPKLGVLKGAARPAEDGRPPRTEKSLVALGGAEIELRAAPNANTAFDNRQFYKLKFLTADADKNGYLGEQEFAAVGLEGVEFKTVDADGDGMIVANELQAYVDKQSAEAAGKIQLVIGSDGRSLFEILDVNLDRRLSVRELRHAFDRLTPFDRDHDGRIAATELAGRYRGTFEMGKPALFQRRAMDMSPANTTPLARPTANGPEWFQKMDRNRDGDVSRKEFLGPRELFDKLDTDHDGLLDATEAAAAK